MAPQDRDWLALSPGRSLPLSWACGIRVAALIPAGLLQGYALPRAVQFYRDVFSPSGGGRKTVRLAERSAPPPWRGKCQRWRAPPTVTLQSHANLANHGRDCGRGYRLLGLWCRWKPGLGWRDHAVFSFVWRLPLHPRLVQVLAHGGPRRRPHSTMPTQYVNQLAGGAGACEMTACLLERCELGIAVHTNDCEVKSAWVCVLMSHAGPGRRWWWRWRQWRQLLRRKRSLALLHLDKIRF